MSCNNFKPFLLLAHYSLNEKSSPKSLITRSLKPLYFSLSRNGWVEVTVGIMGSDEVEILSGLSEGDTVWYREELDIFDFFAGMSGGGMPSGGMPSGGSRPGGSGRPSGGWG